MSQEILTSQIETTTINAERNVVDYFAGMLVGIWLKRHELGITHLDNTDSNFLHQTAVYIINNRIENGTTNDLIESIRVLELPFKQLKSNTMKSKLISS
jgi:tRNA A-37 threonylcarbamoyl transferase component Bud32